MDDFAQYASEGEEDLDHFSAEGGQSFSELQVLRIANELLQAMQVLTAQIERLEQIAMAPVVAEYDDMGNPVSARKVLQDN